ncbi:MAG TPA: carboxypeptidase regulatory-like domain-containing protein [Candidatus Acidoferrum sp.]|nr:carboxypeptidase regulatory-like domain-containing protein [Candidatus Acidoferrum sp.]
MRFGFALGSTYCLSAHLQHNLARTLILTALAACLLASAERAAPQGISEISQVAGFVRDAASHEPVVSARIDLISPNGFAAPTQYSDSNGEFHFGYIKDGDYHILVRKMGYANAELSFSVVAGHQSRLDVDLQREDSDSASGPRPNPGAGPSETVSAHELTVPEKARSDYGRGKDLMAKQDYTGAVEQFQKAIQEFPTFYEAYARMGVAQYMGGQAAEARTSLQKSIDLSNGKYADAMFDLADVLNDINDFAGAEPLARQEIALEDSSWRGHFELARALLGLKHYTDAEQSAKKSLGLNVRNRQVYVILTNIHIGMHDYPSVLRDIDGYLKLDTDSPTAGQMRATRASVVKALADAQGKQGKPNHLP